MSKQLKTYTPYSAFFEVRSEAKKYAGYSKIEKNALIQKEWDTTTDERKGKFERLANEWNGERKEYVLFVCSTEDAEAVSFFVEKSVVPEAVVNEKSVSIYFGFHEWSERLFMDEPKEINGTTVFPTNTLPPQPFTLVSVKLYSTLE